MKKKAILFSVIMLCLGVYQTGQAEEWDLRTCLDMGLKRNPTILGAAKAIEGAQARVTQNLSAYYPNIFGETDYSHYKVNSSGNGSSLTNVNTGSGLAGINSGANDLSTYFLGLSQNIYDFGRREYKVQASREDLKTFQWTLKDVRLSVIDSIRQAYYGVLLTQRIVLVRKEDLERTQEHLKQAQGFYQVGLKAKIDVTQAEVAVINAQKGLLQAENDVRQARVTLAAAIGLEQPPEVTLKDDLETGRVDWNLEDLKKEALEKDPVLNRLRAVITFGEAQVEEAKREFWPTLTGSAKYGFNNGSNYNNDQTWTVGLQLNIPIFTGYFTQAKLAENQAALNQAKANERTQRLLVLSNLQNQYLSQVLADKQIEVAKESLRSATENLDLATGRYKAGIGAMLDVTDARGSYVQSENDYNQALYNYTIARYKVERALGRE